MRLSKLGCAKNSLGKEQTNKLEKTMRLITNDSTNQKGKSISYNAKKEERKGGDGDGDGEEEKKIGGMETCTSKSRV
jgi:hypothetical protein